MMTTSRIKRLVLIDSHAILHRAYHALPDFESSKGEPTGALYGLVSMFLKLVADLKPDYIVACRDLPGGTHRHEVYEDYKATRVQAEDALILQLEKAPRVFKAFGIPIFQEPGFEADDCIGTIVKKVSSQSDIEIVIATGDLDTLQLVSGQKVRVYTLRQGLNDTILYDEDRVRERYGFGPEHITDYKGLRGDPSDNIKGIAGIGEKTATHLITEFGSIEDIYEVLNDDQKELEKAGVKPRIVQLLKDGKKDALFSKKLATIHSDVPLDFSLPKEPWRLEEHLQTIVALCDELEFRSLRERVLTTLKKNGVAATKEAQSSLFGEETKQEDVDATALKETALALWLVRSDVTTPTLFDILDFAHTKDFETARTAVFKALHESGRSHEVYEKIERPLVPVVEHMNARGVVLDRTFLSELSKEYTQELSKIEKRIHTHAGHEFNINSPKQLGEVLFDELGLSLAKQKKTATGARTTKEEELQKMSDQHPIIADVLAYRELQKLLSTYIDKMGELVGSDGRLHAEFLQTGTTTGRMGCQNPNLQNIPIRTEYGRRIRSAFVAPKGYVLAALDYSQIELRIAAGLSGDERLIDVFKKGGDIHTAVAAAVFNVPPEMVDREMRRRAKVINFGILYGMGVNALRQTLGENVSREEASKFLADYSASYPKLARYIENTKRSAALRGYTETLFGRRRYFPGFKSPLPNIRAQAERMAINAPIQGTQSDIIKLAMVEADRVIEKEGWRDDAHLVMQVHDELVYEISKKNADVIVRRLKEIMEQVVSLKDLEGVPIIAEVKMGKSWGELQPLT